jgi:hypothetical protein
MNIVLAAIEPPLADAWERYCGDLESVTVRRGSILEVECDAVVSPANSFGFMDGGIDMLYSRYIGCTCRSGCNGSSWSAITASCSAGPRR